MSKVIAFPGPRRAAFPTCGALALDPAYIEEFPQEELTPRHDVEVIAFPGAWQENQPEESRKTKTRLGVAPKFSEIFSTTCDIPPLFYFVELPLVDARFDWDIRAGPNYILAELNAANQVVATYVPTRTQDDVIVKQNLTLNKTAIYSDFNANLPTKTVRDEVGNVIETLESPEPYGAMQTTGAIDHTRFQGKMQDPVTGFYYFHQRWYDPQARRFVSQDPAPVDEFQPDKIHRYAAFGLNPVQNVDPMGADHLAAWKYNQVTTARNASQLDATITHNHLRDLRVELSALKSELLRIPTSNPACNEFKNWILSKQPELRHSEERWWFWWKYGRHLGMPRPDFSLATADIDFVATKGFWWAPGFEKCHPFEVPWAFDVAQSQYNSFLWNLNVGSLAVLGSSAGASGVGLAIGAGVEAYGAYQALNRLTKYQELALSFGRLGVVPGGGLGAHEGGWWRGHTLLKHVGLTQSQLATRIAQEGLPRGASSFTNIATAEHAIIATISANQSLITPWLAGGARSLTLFHTTPFTAGIHLAPGASAVTAASRVKLLLYRDPASSIGYRIFTSYLLP